jgi:hypothetical protein
MMRDGRESDRSSLHVVVASASSFICSSTSCWPDGSSPVSFLNQAELNSYSSAGLADRVGMGVQGLCKGGLGASLPSS